MHGYSRGIKCMHKTVPSAQIIIVEFCSRCNDGLFQYPVESYDKYCDRVLSRHIGDLAFVCSLSYHRCAAQYVWLWVVTGADSTRPSTVCC